MSFFNSSVKYLVNILFMFLIMLCITLWFMFLVAEDKIFMNEKSVVHTHETISQAKSLLTNMIDAETGQRGFILTLEKKYLEPYSLGVTKTYSDLEKLKELTVDNYAQQLKLTNIEFFVKNKFSELKTTIDLASNGKKEEALILIKQDIGKREMDKLRKTLTSFISEEQSLLKQKTNKLQSDISFINTMKYLLSSLLFLTIIFIYIIIHKKLVGPILRLTDKVKAVANTTISTSGSNNEIASLSNAIEIMNLKINQNTWLQEGTVTLNNTLLGNLDIAQLSTKSLEFLCNYLHVGSGSLYIFNEDNETLTRQATYAYTSQKKDSVIKLGEGTIGQVALQKKHIHLKNITDSNVLIQTGETKIKTVEMYVCPLLYQGTLQAVIEISSHSFFDTKSQEFLRVSTSIIATALVGAKQAYNVKNLLQKSENDNLSMLQKQNALDAHAIVGITDTKGTITYANAKFSEISGYSNEELVGANHRVVNSGTYDDAFWDEMYKTLNAGKVWRHPAVKNKAKNGAFYWIDTTIFPFMDAQGKAESYIAIRTDVTKSKQLEADLIEAKKEAEAAAVTKSDFLASMSHEIRTPMNGVIGMLDLLARDKLTKQQSDKVQIADASAKSLLSVINDILDFSKIEAGKVELEDIEFDAQKELGNFAKSIAVTIKNEQIELLLDLNSLEHYFMYGDIGRLKQILNNLVGNAIKFTHQGSIVIKAHLSDVQGNHANLCISVEDSGIGIAKDKIATLFDAFTQADTSTTRKYGGTGLGLSIAKNLVAHMGGELKVASELGRGSTFSFCINVTLSDKQPDSMPSTDIRGQEILIVDDNAVNIHILTSQLKLWDIKVTSALSAQEAISLCTSRDKNNFFDIAILDMQMPDKDGETLGQELSQMEVCKNMKMMMMTSFGRHQDINILHEKGFDAFFMKPTTASDLYDALLVLAHGSKVQEYDTLLTKDKLNAFTQKEFQNPQNINILLVEDNLTNQLVAQSMLSMHGLKADIVNNGQEAIETLQEPNALQYDIILMDCQMPILDGYQTTILLREGKCGKRYENIPIIAMTANAMKGDKEKCLSFGMSDYVSKPIVSEILKDVIMKWI
ncbi:response regulator [Sulfurimonas sp. SAG-AH-194-I05]|nr:response regulator [Sulfurimonas sp. SAG-AH-194-I05]MDF1876014.1 response regulator [Sulfurimonas sp. SAG-AH-194-I05]